MPFGIGTKSRIRDPFTEIINIGSGQKSFMRFDIVTIFPHIFDSYFNESIIKRAQVKNLVDIRVHDLRDYAKVVPSFDKLRINLARGNLPPRRQVDDKPYGGGAGMVLMAEPILRAVQRIKPGVKTKVVVLSAKGRQFDQKMAYDWAKKYKNIVFITGRYEGIDERAAKVLGAEEISIGPYITTDGDVAAMVMISALTRLIPDVISGSSLEEESFFRKTISQEAETGKLEYPHYTRPEVLKYKGKKYRVPKVLLSGNHKEIAEWRRKHQGSD